MKQNKHWILDEDTEKSQFIKPIVVYIGSKIFLLYYKLLQLGAKFLNFKLSNGQLIFHVHHKQSTLVEIYGKHECMP